MNDIITEHAIMMFGGGMHVRNQDVERVYPLVEWVKHQQRNNGKVWQRRIIVVEDWTEVSDD